MKMKASVLFCADEQPPMLLIWKIEIQAWPRYFWEVNLVLHKYSTPLNLEDMNVAQQSLRTGVKLLQSGPSMCLSYVLGSLSVYWVSEWVSERCFVFYVGYRIKNLRQGASLVAQWLRICLPTQETRVRALVWEDPTCRGATGPVSRNYWACASGACAPQQERPR